MDLKTFAVSDAESVVRRYVTERGPATAETEAERRVVRAAEAILRGARLLDVRDAVIKGGRNTSHLPKLAVARITWARVRWNPDVSAYENPDDKHTDTLLRGVLLIGGCAGRALVPPMPPAVRTLAAKDDLILWEAEWRDVVARDPVLLRPFDGDVYELVAAWDLTDLERAILGTA